MVMQTGLSNVSWGHSEISTSSRLFSVSHGSLTDTAYVLKARPALGENRLTPLHRFRLLSPGLHDQCQSRLVCMHGDCMRLGFGQSRHSFDQKLRDMRDSTHRQPHHAPSNTRRISHLLSCTDPKEWGIGLSSNLASTGKVDGVLTRHKRKGPRGGKK